MRMSSGDIYSKEKSFRWHPPMFFEYFSFTGYYPDWSTFPPIFYCLCSELSAFVCLCDLFDLLSYENVCYVGLYNWYLENFTNFTGKHLCWSLFFIKLQGQNFFCRDHPQMTASEYFSLLLHELPILLKPHANNCW